MSVSRERRSAVLLNSTSSYVHAGCYLTTAGLKNLLLLCNIQVIFETGVNQYDLKHAADILSLDKRVLLIVNGEGTFHDDQPYAVHLLSFISGLRNFKLLLNTQIKNFSSECIEKLKFFDLVQARTKKDVEYGKEIGLENIVYCPDMLFYSGIKELPYFHPKSKSIIFTDSHDESSSKEIYRIYNNCEENKEWVNFHFLPIGFDLRFHFLKKAVLLKKIKFLNGFCSYKELNVVNTYAYSNLLERFMNSSKVVTGRYHGACLAIALGKELIYGSSNTSKTFDLCTDFDYGDQVEVGIDLNHIGSCSRKTMSEIESLLEKQFNELCECINKLLM